MADFDHCLTAAGAAGLTEAVWGGAGGQGGPQPARLGHSSRGSSWDQQVRGRAGGLEQFMERTYACPHQVWLCQTEAQTGAWVMFSGVIST